MKCILFVFLFVISSIEFFGSSPQVADYLIYKNDTIITYNLLVEQYLQKYKDDKGKLFNLSFRESINGSSGGSLNCWRGYQAIYKIENDSLFVKDIIECHSIKNFNVKKSKMYLKQIFKEKIKNGKVYVDWFSGEVNFLHKTEDNMLLRWDGVFEKIFMFETILKIEEGRIINVSNVKNYTDLENGIDRLKKDSITNTLFKYIKSYRWKKLEKFDCGEKYIVTINENGKVGHIRMAWSDKDIEEFFTKREYNYCIKSMKKALSQIQFDIIKRKGKLKKEKVLIEIWFKDDGTIENWTN